MDQQETNRQMEEPEGSRPGPKTFAAVIVIGLMVFAFFNWSDVKAAIDFL